MYDILLKAQKGRMKYFEEGSIPDGKKIILILGQPGIGKTWFLTYVLVRRLLKGKLTILQVGVSFIGDSRLSAAGHYLIDGNGFRQIDEVQLFFERDKADIWVLAVETPFGLPRVASEHIWLAVVTSSPREANYKHLVKQYPPEKYYLSTWDWHEVVAAA